MLEFIELQSKDRVGAFVGYITIAEAKEEGLIPEEYHDSFRDKCACGSDRIIKHNLTSFMCCDPRCWIKVAHSLSYMFSKFQCKNVGEKTCLSIVKSGLKHMPVKSHLYFLTHGSKHLPMDLGGAAISNFEVAVSQVRSTILSFPDLVSKLAIPSLGSVANKIFSDISSVDHLVQKMNEEGGVQAFMLNRGVADLSKTFYLHEFLQDIAYAEKVVFKKLMPVGQLDLNIVMTGKLYLQGQFLTKEKFVALCNRLGVISPTFRLFDIKAGKALEGSDFFIASSASTSEKYLKAKERESMEGKKLLYTPEEFLDFLKERVDFFKSSKNIEEGVQGMEVF